MITSLKRFGGTRVAQTYFAEHKFALIAEQTSTLRLQLCEFPRTLFPRVSKEYRTASTARRAGRNIIRNAVT